MKHSVAKRVLEAYLTEQGKHYEKEYRFAKDRKFRLDYYLPDYDLGVEFEGGVWVLGRHNRATGFLKDMEKYNLLTNHAIWLLRATTKNIADGSFMQSLERHFTNYDRGNNEGSHARN